MLGDSNRGRGDVRDSSVAGRQKELVFSTPGRSLLCHPRGNGNGRWAWTSTVNFRETSTCWEFNQYTKGEDRIE